MQLTAICGSARKHGNTAAMLRQVMKGAESAGCKTELVNLFDIDYKGCTGCCICKLNNKKFFGHCAVDDDLKPLLERIEKTDIIVLGSPVYYGNLSGQMRSFTDRLLFQYLDYGAKSSGPKPKEYRTALIATMNVNREISAVRGFDNTLKNFADIIGHTLGPCELLMLRDTVMFDDYSKYVYQMDDKDEKAKRKEKISEIDLQNAFNLGVRLVTG